MTKDQKKEMEIVAKFKTIIDNKFNECPLNKKKALFESLEEWAKTELDEKQSQLFLEALYDAQSTQNAQLEIALDKALNKIEGNQNEKI